MVSMPHKSGQTTNGKLSVSASLELSAASSACPRPPGTPGVVLKRVSLATIESRTLLVIRYPVLAAAPWHRGYDFLD